MGQNIGRGSVKISGNYGRVNPIGNRQKKESEVKSKRVTVQVTKREKEILELLAKREGQTPSEYIRFNCIYQAYNRLTGGDSID